VVPSNGSDYSSATVEPDANYPHPWSVFFTILGTMLLDFDADACQSPSRAYLLDVTVPGKWGILPNPALLLLLLLLLLFLYFPFVLFSVVSISIQRLPFCRYLFCPFSSERVDMGSVIDVSEIHMPYNFRVSLEGKFK
jgi:hypothetical protein